MVTYKEFLKEYGSEKVKFSSYYKYSFMFRNDKGLLIKVGGNSSDIYKLTVNPIHEYLVSELEPITAWLNEEKLGDWSL